jgi:diacylglycerol kinase family enzyme
MVICAGTSNPVALDLGPDRENPAICLDGLRDGVEVRVDLVRIGDRTFVDSASFGAYAAVVQSAAYRDDKVGTALDMLPDLLAGHHGPHLSLRAGIDGEPVTVSTPISCTIHPAALRVRVPRHRPGVPPPRREMDWIGLRRPALSTGRG